MHRLPRSTCSSFSGVLRDTICATREPCVLCYHRQPWIAQRGSLVHVQGSSGYVLSLRALLLRHPPCARQLMCALLALQVGGLMQRARVTIIELPKMVRAWPLCGGSRQYCVRINPFTHLTTTGRRHRVHNVRLACFARVG